MRLLLGHTVGERVYEFPHGCPGEGCAVARWILEHDTARRLSAGTIPIVPPRLATPVVTDGTVWPDLVAEVLK